MDFCIYTEEYNVKHEAISTTTKKLVLLLVNQPALRRQKLLVVVPKLLPAAAMKTDIIVGNYTPSSLLQIIFSMV